ncbi:MAG TPA: hypothetical protein VMS77_05405 [Conexivisphaerales archaeon]|nr:hypothetical protein [Conexivisphaerales archaeon]
MPHMHLIQTKVSKETLKALDALARAVGHKRAGYLRHLVEVHVRAIEPKLLASLSKTRPDVLSPKRRPRGQ